MIGPAAIGEFYVCPADGCPGSTTKEHTHEAPFWASGERFGLAARIHYLCYQRLTHRARRAEGTERRAMPRPPVIAPVGAWNPAGDERCRVPGCPGGELGVRKISGMRIGIPYLVHRACYYRVMRQGRFAEAVDSRAEPLPEPVIVRDTITLPTPPRSAKRGGVPDQTDPPRPELPPVLLPPVTFCIKPPLPSPYDKLTPAEASELVRKLWGTPACSLVLMCDCVHQRTIDPARLGELVGDLSWSEDNDDGNI